MQDHFLGDAHTSPPKLIATSSYARKIPPSSPSPHNSNPHFQAYHSIFLQDTDVRLIGTSLSPITPFLYFPVPSPPLNSTLQPTFPSLPSEPGPAAQPTTSPPSHPTLHPNTPPTPTMNPTTPSTKSSPSTARTHFLGISRSRAPRIGC